MNGKDPHLIDNSRRCSVATTEDGVCLWGKKSIDIGSGDGRIVIEASRHGLHAYGVEINPILYIVSKIKIRNSGSKNTKILLKDMWQLNFSSYDYVTIWGTKHMVKNLGVKLKKEVKPGAKIVSNHFQFTNWKPKKSKDDVYLYIKWIY